MPPHVHASQWERFEGVSGELRFRLGLRRRTVGCGDVVVVPPGTAHGLRNIGREVAHFLIELSPPRRGEEGLRALFGLQRDGRVRVTRFAARPLLQIAVLFDEYLDEVHLPLVPFAVQRLAFGALARVGRRRGYGSAFPEYAPNAAAKVGGTWQCANTVPWPLHPSPSFSPPPARGRATDGDVPPTRNGQSRPAASPRCS